MIARSFDFLAKGIFFAASLAALMHGLDVFLTAMTPWRRYEDPHARILWDGAFDGAPIVLLGGSEFASVYGDSPSERLWIRLETYTGQQVFPGALNGARPLDVVAAAVHISRQWPDGTTVFISLAPTRFIVSQAPEPPTGNFAEPFFWQYGIDAGDEGIVRRVEGQVCRWILKPFLAVRTRSALANFVDRPRPPGWMRRRVWLQEREMQKERFEFFERNLVMGARPRTFEWVGRIKAQLEDAGMRPVFVLTPLNEALVRSFASVYSADSVVGELRGIVASLRGHLDQIGAAVIDLTDGVIPVECFFDLVHVNTCGDDLMARRLAAWFKQHGQDRRAEHR
jgi:hypothetical protein